MIGFNLLALLLAGAPADEVRIDSGRGKFDALPRITVERPLPMATLVDKVQKILASGKCRELSSTARVFDITIPYAVEVRPDGSTSHVIVGDRGCPEIEKLVGNVVVQLAALGDFKAQSASAPKWYASEINFTLQ